MRVWQIRLSVQGRVAMFPDEALRRRAVQAATRVAGPALLSLSVPDNHGHLLVLTEDERAARLARGVRLAWGPLAAAELEPRWCAPIRSGKHLREAFEYQLGQNLRHGDVAHPATWSASCFVDLVGARALERLDPKARLREAMPRYRLRDAYRVVGLPPVPLSPASDEQIRAAGMVRLVDAASAACCADPVLEGRTAAVVRTRRCVARLARAAGFGTAAVATALRVSAPTARRLAHAVADERGLRATRMRLALEEAVALASSPAGSILPTGPNRS